MAFCVFSQGGIGEKGAEGTAGNDGARVSETILFSGRAGNQHHHYCMSLPELFRISLIFPWWSGFGRMMKSEI